MAQGVSSSLAEIQKDLKEQHSKGSGATSTGGAFDEAEVRTQRVAACREGRRLSHEVVLIGSREAAHAPCRSSFAHAGSESSRPGEEMVVWCCCWASTKVHSPPVSLLVVAALLAKHTRAAALRERMQSASRRVLTKGGGTRQARERQTARASTALI